MRFKGLIILYFILISCFCYSKGKDIIIYEAKGYKFPYKLNLPDHKINLPEILEEISGLSYINKKTLLGIQDEKGMLFYIDAKTGKIKEEIKFSKNADFEGVESVNGTIWIIESNGDLHRFKNEKHKKYENFLNEKNNCEGLAYDNKKKQLLIACKAYPYPGKQKGKINEKAIYAFKLKTKKLKKDPVLTIQLDSIRQKLKMNSMAKAGMKILTFLNPSRNDIIFRPSGIAIHPKTRDYYILGSTGNLLVVYSSSGILKAIVKLKSSKFPQAEGICFSPKGKLFISNEGNNNEDSFILTFNPINKK